jgi:hypothetical protein
MKKGGVLTLELFRQPSTLTLEVILGGGCPFQA